MHLKSVSLQGFKTFAGRTTLELRPGITAIVGPNGSGKSNIADAVRWALGETNLRHVRCRATDELIFAGNARRSSLGLAEVSLVFANEGGWLSVPFNEVRVTRRAYRSGENEYLLNGTRVRLRDIVDLLAGASIHAGGHVVVNQGLVDSVLSLRPEERRSMVENLAGLKQYYLRRDEAEGRLAQTEANLVHVDAVLAELAPQLESLSQQAQVLRAYRDAEAELRRLQQATFGAQAVRLLARAAGAQQRTDQALALLAEARAEEARTKDSADGVASALDAERVEREDLRQRVAAQRSLAAAAQRDRDVAAAQALAAAERVELARAERARLAETVELERKGLREARAAVDALRAQAAQVERQVMARRDTVEALSHERDRAAAAARKAQTSSQEAARTTGRLAEAVAVSAAAVDSLSRELERHEAAVTAADVALHDAELAQASAVEAQAIQLEVQARAATAAQEAASSADEIRKAVSAAQSELREAAREQERIGARHGVLQSWLRSLDGFDAPVRGLARHRNARGIVANCLRVSREWQVPIAALLGARYEAVLTDDVDALLGPMLDNGTLDGRVYVVVTGDRRLSAAPERGEGASSTSQDAIAQPSPAVALSVLCASGVLEPDDMLGWAAGVCEDLSEVKARQALQLDRVLLLRSAGALLRCHAHLAGLGLSAVARDRALAALADGSVVCGVDERTSEIIRRREELTLVETALGEAKAREATARERLASEQARLTLAEQQHEQTRKSLGAADAALARAREEARFHERLVLQSRRTAAAAGPITTRLTTDLRERRTRLEAEEARLAAARDERERIRRIVDASQAALSQMQERVGAAGTQRREDELAVSRVRDGLASATKIAEERDRYVANLAADLARYADQEQNAGRLVATLEEAREAAAARQSAVAAMLESLEAELRPLEIRIAEEESNYAALRAALRLATEQQAKAQSTWEAARRELDAAIRDTDVLRAQVSAELRCELEDLPDAAAPHGAISRVKALRAELAAIGLVNARAEEDLAAVEERLGFLHTQAADLRDGVARLRTIIEEANSTVRERFAATVDQLDEQFKSYFARLFGGGSCQLVAEYDDLGQPTGVEVRAQPPGKRTRDLALLSGGERALVAMALLFAMLRVRPVPFCLLDEVEAALDESNTGRFGAILKELSASTQFLLVTHNRGTMLQADRMYGITMSDAGVSIAASLEISGVVAADESLAPVANLA